MKQILVVGADSLTQPRQSLWRTQFLRTYTQHEVLDSFVLSRLHMLKVAKMIDSVAALVINYAEKQAFDFRRFNPGQLCRV